MGGQALPKKSLKRLPVAPCQKLRKSDLAKPETLIFERGAVENLCRYLLDKRLKTHLRIGEDVVLTLQSALERHLTKFVRQALKYTVVRGQTTLQVSDIHHAYDGSDADVPTERMHCECLRKSAPSLKDARIEKILKKCDVQRKAEGVCAELQLRAMVFLSMELYKIEGLVNAENRPQNVKAPTIKSTHAAYVCDTAGWKSTKKGPTRVPTA